MDVYIREDITVDEFIDVLIGNRRYVSCLYVYNKIDTIDMEQVDKLARLPKSVVISVELELGLDGLKKAIWEELGLLRIFTKPRGKGVDLTDPLVVRRNSTMEDVVSKALSEYRCVAELGLTVQFNTSEHSIEVQVQSCVRKEQ